MIAAPVLSEPVVEEAKAISASRLNTWLSCRLKYFFRYVLHIKSHKTAALYVGSIVHEVLKQWNRARWKKSLLNLEQLEAVYELAWVEEQVEEPVSWGKDEEVDEKKVGWKLLKAYFSKTPILPDERPEGVEVTVEADLSRYGLPKIMGIMDLVRSNGRIVDYKTVAQTPKSEKAIHQNEVQLTMYSVLYRESTGQREGGRELHHLVKIKDPKIIITEQGPMTDKEQTRLFKQLESFVKGTENEDYVPSPGFQCLGCPYFNRCRLWS